MSKTIVITQPNYLPWLGYFEQMARADVFVLLDSVQFEQHEWQNRNRLKGANGLPYWLTVPVTRSPLNTRIADVRISDQREWRRKHLGSIQGSLAKAPFFKTFESQISEWIQTPYETLADLNIAGIQLIARLLDLNPIFKRGSEFSFPESRTELLVAICRELGATRYYSSLGAKVYMEAEEHLFRDASIEVEYQQWPHPVYPQRCAEFVSHLSVLDVLANIGPEATRNLLFPAPASAAIS